VAEVVDPRPPTPTRHRARWRIVVGAAAACLVVGLGAWAGAVLWSHGHTDVAALRSATAVALGPEQATCRVALMGGRPGWVLVAIDEPGGDSDNYPVLATVSSPGVSDVKVDLGSLATTAGHGVLAVQVADAGLVHTIIVNDSSGKPKYTLRPTL
jgi:hypothetical protein